MRPAESDSSKDTRFEAPEFWEQVAQPEAGPSFAELRHRTQIFTARIFSAFRSRSGTLVMERADRNRFNACGCTHWLHLLGN